MENLAKNGKMFGVPGGGRREFSPFPGPANMYPGLGEYGLELGRANTLSATHVY